MEKLEMLLRFKPFILIKSYHFELVFSAFRLVFMMLCF